MINCTSENCRTQEIEMAYIKGAFVGVFQSCYYNLFACENPKKRTRDESFGGVALSGTATIEEVDYAFYDSFTGTGDLSLHTPEVGNAWTLGTGTLTLADGKLNLLEDGAEFRIIFSNTLSIADAVIDFFMLYDPTFESGMTFSFNMIDENNKWLLYFSAPSFQLFSNVNGVGTSHGTYMGEIGASSMDLKIITNGNSLDILQDGVSLFSLDIPNRPNKLGTGFEINWFKTDGYVQFDKITAYTP